MIMADSAEIDVALDDEVDTESVPNVVADSMPSAAVGTENVPAEAGDTQVMMVWSMVVLLNTMLPTLMVTPANPVPVHVIVRGVLRSTVLIEARFVEKLEGTVVDTLKAAT